MRQRTWLDADGVLIQPWVVVGLTVFLVVLLAATVLPWQDVGSIVPSGELPSVQYVEAWDIEWDDLTAVVSIDEEDRIWVRPKGVIRPEELPEVLRSQAKSAYRRGTRNIGRVLFRPHREARWSTLATALRMAAETGARSICIACRDRDYARERFLFVRFTDEPEREKRRRTPYEGEVIEIRSLDAEAAKRDRQRIDVERRSAKERRDIFFEPSVAVTLPSNTTVQDALAILERYVPPDDIDLRLSGPR